ncbi:uncharacterized protein [Prorops nasuta]|uniref:uncharacterized protein n=1 Tax=Prorops nasuta TaxID=863751 RepID=UPI0034CE6E83
MGTYKEQNILLSEERKEVESNIVLLEKKLKNAFSLTENTDLNHNLLLQSLKDVKDDAKISESELAIITSELKKLSCPVTWKLEKGFDYYKHIMDVTNCELDFENNDILPFQSIIGFLVTSIQELYYGRDDAAEKKFNEAFKLYTELIEMDDMFYLKKVLKHVVYATKCYIFYSGKKFSAIKNLLQDIPNSNDFDTQELGVISGCVGIATDLCMRFDPSIAIQHFEAAINMDPDSGLWHFCLAKLLRLQRRRIDIRMKPSSREEQEFTIAYNLSKNPIFGIYIARLMRESLSNVKGRNQLISFENKMVELYDEVFLHAKSNHRILLMLALGYIRIKTHDKSKEARECLELVQKLLPDNSMYFHYQAKYMEKFGTKEEVIYYFKKASEKYNFCADCDYASYIARTSMEDALEYLESLIPRYNDFKECNQGILLKTATTYYSHGNIKRASELFLKALNIDAENDMLKKPYHFIKFDTNDFKNGIYGFLRFRLLPEIKRSYSSDHELVDIGDKIRAIVLEFGNSVFSLPRKLSENK